MKNTILLSIIAMSLFLAPQKSKAHPPQLLEIQNAPSNFTKAQFTQLFINAGVTQHMSVKSIVNSLHYSQGKWYCSMSLKQINKVIAYSNGKFTISNGVIVNEEMTEI